MIPIKPMNPASVRLTPAIEASESPNRERRVSELFIT